MNETVRELLIRAEQAQQHGDYVLANHLTHEANELAWAPKDEIESQSTNDLISEIWG